MKKLVLILILLLLVLITGTLGFAIAHNGENKEMTYDDKVEWLSNMSDDECRLFLLERGIALTKPEHSEDGLGQIKRLIEYTIEYPDAPAIYSAPDALMFAYVIQYVVNDYLGVVDENNYPVTAFDSPFAPNSSPSAFWKEVWADMLTDEYSQYSSFSLQKAYWDKFFKE